MSYEKVKYQKIGKYLVTVEEVFEEPTPPVVVPPPVAPLTQWVGFAMNTTKTLTEWKTAIAKASKWRFNTVRIPFYFSSYDASQMLQVLFLTNQAGLKAILDYHIMGGSTYTPLVGSEEWYTSWEQMALNFKNDNRVLAYELANEPTSTTLDGWMKVGNVQKNLLIAYSKCTDRIRKIDPVKTIVWQVYWGGVDPTPYWRDNVVASVHPYFSEGDVARLPDLAAIVKRRFDDTARYAPNFPIWTGEIESVNWDFWEKQYREPFMIEVLKQSLARGYGFNYYHYYNPLDDGGVDPDKVIRLAGLV